MARDNGDIVAGQVSNGLFHWKSPNPVLATEAMKGQIRTAVGWTIPELTKALNEDPVVIFHELVTELR